MNNFVDSHRILVREGRMQARMKEHVARWQQGIQKSAMHQHMQAIQENIEIAARAHFGLPDPIQLN